MTRARNLADLADSASVLDDVTATAAELNLLDGKAFLDEDNFASNSATGIASQQSIKAYVDGITTTNVTATGALDGGSITSGFGNIDNGTSTITTTGDITAGNFVTSGNVDGRDVSVDGTKLDGIEASATADQTNAEIRTAVEAATDSNVFTDADHTKLNAIEASADVTDATNVTAAGALMDSEVTNLAQVKAFSAADYATAAQGTLAANALPKAGGAVTGNVTFGDSNKIVMGAGSDLELYHDGGNSFVDEVGNGRLYIRASDGIFLSTPSNALYLSTYDTGNVSLYHNGVKKFDTTSSGIDVTGTVNADALTGIGSIDATTAASITAAGVGGSTLGRSWYRAYDTAGGSTDYRGAATSSSKVMIGKGGAAPIISTDGIRFSAAGSGTTYPYSIRVLAYSSSLDIWVAGSSNGRIAYSSNDGANWTLVNTGTNADHYGLHWNGSMFVSVSEASGTIYSSTNGTSWTSRLTTSTAIKDVTYGNGNWVAVGASSTVWYSSNGTSWSTTSTGVPSGQTWNAVHYANGYFVACAPGGQSMYSTNGTSWTGYFGPSSVVQGGIDYIGGVWACGGSTNGIISFSEAHNGPWREIPQAAGFSNSVNTALSTSVGGQKIIFPASNGNITYSV